MIYMDMLDIYKLSYQNDWIDDKGIFIYYSIASIENARLCSRPKAIKILKELEEKGYIIKEAQKGKPTKIYLVENEYTQLELEDIEKNKKDKKSKKFVSKKVQQEEVTESNNVGVEVVEEVTEIASVEPSIPVADYTENQSIFDVFKAIIGREPDNSFKKCMARRAREMNITAENIRGIIELARKARNPEAYILALTKPNAYQEQQTTYKPKAAINIQSTQDAPLDEFELEWLISIEEKKKQEGEECNLQQIEKWKQMLDSLKAQKSNADAPLEDWELEWLEDFHRRKKENQEMLSNVSSLDTSQATLLELQGVN